jgi:RND family efflux transporter MFP subunit
LIRITAPEFEAKCQEAQAKVKAARSELLQSESRLERARADIREAIAKKGAIEVTNRRLVDAARTPGVIADNEVDVSNKELQAADEHVQAMKQACQAAESDVAAARETLGAAEKSLQSLNDMRAYLTITAPFTGMITTRTVHEGSFVSPVGHSEPMVRLQQLNHLRLVVPVPEVAFSGVHQGMTINFTVPAHPSQVFSATVTRVSHMLDQKTRTMPVEADVYTDGELAPGMFANVQWVTTRPHPTMFVPATAVATNLEHTYVLRIKDGRTDVVDVERGQPMGDKIELFGNVHPGDQVALKARDDLKQGTKVIARPAETGTDLDGKHTGAGD